MSLGSNTPPSDEAIRRAARTLARGRHLIAAMTPRQQAEAAWTPTCGATVDELEDEIRVIRGLPPLHRGEVVDD